MKRRVVLALATTPAVGPASADLVELFAFRDLPRSGPRLQVT